MAKKTHQNNTYEDAEGFSIVQKYVTIKVVQMS